MRVGDVVIFKTSGMPTIGQVVGFTPKRVRLVTRKGKGYISVLRSSSNVRVEKRSKVML